MTSEPASPIVAKVEAIGAAELVKRLHLLSCERDALRLRVEEMREAARLVCAEAVAIGKGGSMAVSKETIGKLSAALAARAIRARAHKEAQENDND